MGVEQPSSYYDMIFARQKSSVVYSPPWPLDREMYPRLIEVAKVIPRDKDVYDIGCSIGVLAGVLAHQGHTGVYTGLDFSNIAVAYANSIHEVSPIHPDAAFLCVPIVPKTLDIIPAKATVVFAEFLEHVQDDLGIISTLQKDTNIVITVPSFDDPGHTRWFESAKSVSARYKDLINITFCGNLYTEDHYLHDQGFHKRWMLLGKRK